MTGIFVSAVLAMALTVVLQASHAVASDSSPDPDPSPDTATLVSLLLPRRGGDDGEDPRRFTLLPATADRGRWTDVDDDVARQLAQFQLPPTQPELGAPTRPAVSRLTYQYAYGSESEITYRRNRDLHDLPRDNFLLMKPQLNAIIVYRPTDWLEAVLEMITEWEIPIKEEQKVILPSGEVQRAPKRRWSLVVDQAFVKLHNVIAPFEISLGRKNYEDERHWLYDSSLDVASVAFRRGPVNIEATIGREIWMDMDVAPNQRQPVDRINTYMLYGDYRGIEDLRLAAYTIVRDNRLTDKERKLAVRKDQIQLVGVRALGRPIDSFNYWVELAYMFGKDGPGRDGPTRRFSAYGYDVGGTYRFASLPLSPSITLAYAFGSGDESPTKKTNNEFRQSGLQSNETRFSGVSKFKIYGEALDPELSNLHILTAGVGFRPLPNVFVDVVYHRYRLDEFAQSLHNSALTAEMNQVEIIPRSKDVGSGLDLVIGFRRLFGLRRLGLDVRTGWFFPGRAFMRNEGTEDQNVIRRADQGVSVIAKFWW